MGGYWNIPAVHHRFPEPDSWWISTKQNKHLQTPGRFWAVDVDCFACASLLWSLSRIVKHHVSHLAARPNCRCPSQVEPWVDIILGQLEPKLLVKTRVTFSPWPWGSNRSWNLSYKQPHTVRIYIYICIKQYIYIYIIYIYNMYIYICI